ncbi:hypothetical protein CL684_00660 [Candidatus Campbellbacteria bacterium]|nr:hypothetical protein [Candidatus Campbellbacteria bacterium]|tara:strand:+ start:430 stop:1356 length:927 start_codon:yes stop_codon:yes gene_type:complete
MNTSYLPSKKIQITILILIVLLCGFLAFFFFDNERNETDENTFVDVAAVTSDEDNINTLDSDGDGAYDWQEELWPELDPNNPDSDGDGVLDGQYIRLKQNEAILRARGEENVESDLTETEKFARTAVTALIAVAQSGGELTEEQQRVFSENLANYVQNLTLGEKLYTRDSFNLVSNTKENIRAYSNGMKQLFRTYPVATSDIELIITALEEPEVNQGGLRAINKKYGDYLIELSSQEVPQNIAARHTQLTNSISQLGAATDNLLQEEQDELITLSLVAQLETILSNAAAAIINLNKYFEIVEDDIYFN